MASEKEIAWDLSEIYAEYNDPKISQTMDVLKKQTDNFFISFPPFKTD